MQMQCNQEINQVLELFNQKINRLRQNNSIIEYKKILIVT